MQELTPGGSAVWQVGVSADAESPGTLTVTIAGTAAPDTELRYQVQGCPQRWTSDTCPGSQVLVPDSPAPTDGVALLLRTMRRRAAVAARRGDIADGCRPRRLPAAAHRARDRRG